MPRQKRVPQPGEDGWKFEWKRLLATRADLPRRAKTVGNLLSDYANSDGTNARPSIATLACDTGYSTRSVDYALADLKAAGLITPSDERHPKGKFGSDVVTYTLTAPTSLAQFGDGS